MLFHYVNFAIDSVMSEQGQVTGSALVAFLRNGRSGVDILSMYFAYVIDRILDHF